MKQIIFSPILIFVFCFIAVAQENKGSCPTITVTSPAEVAGEGGYVSFKSEIGKEAEKYNIEFVWTVEGGKIVDGQGTKIIKVLVENYLSVTATFAVKGLPKNCPNSVSEKYSCPDCRVYQNEIPGSIDPVPFDKFYKLSINDLKGRFDNFFVSLSKDEDSKGLVVLQLDKNESKSKKVRRIKEISKHFNLRKIDMSQITFQIYESHNELTKIWLVPKGADITILYDDNEDYKIIRGEDLKQKIKELFPKK